MGTLRPGKVQNAHSTPPSKSVAELGPEPRCPDSWIKALPTTRASLLPASSLLPSPLTPPFPAVRLQAASWELALPTHLCLYSCSSSYQSFKTQIESLPSGNLPLHPQSLPFRMGDSYIAGFGLSRPIPSLQLRPKEGRTFRNGPHHILPPAILQFCLRIY